MYNEGTYTGPMEKTAENSIFLRRGICSRQMRTIGMAKSSPSVMMLTALWLATSGRRCRHWPSIAASQDSEGDLHGNIQIQVVGK